MLHTAETTKLLVFAWDLLEGEAATALHRRFADAESPIGSADLGSRRRRITVGESSLWWVELSGARVAGQVAVAIGPESGPESASPATAFRKPADWHKRAKALHFGAFTPESLSAWLKAPLYATTLPPLLKKGSQAALAAAAVVAAAEALKDRRRKADTFGPFGTEGERAAAVAVAVAASPGDPLREAYVAWTWFDETQRRNDLFEAHLCEQNAFEEEVRAREELEGIVARLPLPPTPGGSGMEVDTGEAVEFDPAPALGHERVGSKRAAPDTSTMGHSGGGGGESEDEGEGEVATGSSSSSSSSSGGGGENVMGDDDDVATGSSSSSGSSSSDGGGGGENAMGDDDDVPRPPQFELDEIVKNVDATDPELFQSADARRPTCSGTSKSTRHRPRHQHTLTVRAAKV